MSTTTDRTESSLGQAVELEGIFADYLNRLERRNRVKSSIENCRRALTYFQTWLREQELNPEHVTEEDLERYFGRGLYAVNTYRSHAQQVRSAYSYAHRRGIVTADPFVDYELPARPDPDIRAKLIPNSELRAMRKRCPLSKHELLWAMLTFTGMRRDEIRRAMWEDLDRDTWTLNVVGKAQKRRVVPVHPVLQELLHDATKYGDLTGAIISPSHGRVMTATGKSYNDLSPLVERFSDHPCHSFRKTLASSLARNGVESMLIDRIFGWAPIGIRESYYIGVQLDQLHAAIRKAYLNDPVG
jgi:integrase